LADTFSPEPGTAPVDLTNCDREPIHQLGRVQSYGTLLAVSQDWIVQHCSENAAGLLGLPEDSLLGRPLSDLIVSDGFERLRSNLRAAGQQDGTTRLFDVVLTARGQGFDVSMHYSGAHLIVELEPKTPRRGGDVMSEVYPHIRALPPEAGLADLAREAARGLRALSGFDSVMVYEFQPDQSGRVIAEDRADRGPRYMGQRFPASDIPAQARALYARALLRLIADTEDPGAAILPPQTVTGAPLDLSLSVTRAVSPIHIEYLRNMGVRASMSVSIMRDGELWGLFACHHDSPRYIDFERRTAIEMFAHLFAYELGRHLERQKAKAQADMAQLQSRLMAHMANGAALPETLLSVSDDLRAVIPHDGMVLFTDGHVHATGDAPTEEEFRALARVFDRSIGSGVFASEHLAEVHPPAADYAGRCAGVLAIPISRRPRDYIALCRREQVTTVDWAGDPAKPATLGPNGVRLTPRKSFEVWQETVRGRSAPWSPHARHAADLLRTVLLEIFLKITDAASEERRHAQQQQQLLISELNHRVRNILNLMRGLVAQTKSSARSLGEFTANLDGRIQSLARAHDQLTAERWEPASLKSLITCEFDAYAQPGARRLRIDGPDALIGPNAYTALALVLHEMTTNSVKYGALCDNSGSVRITLSEDRGGALEIRWVERGGPPVSPPRRRGFGTTIIETSIPHELKGDAQVDYHVTGLEARFRIPPAHVTAFLPEDRQPAAAPQARAPRAPAALQGRGLVVEDSLIIALDAQSTLEAAGASEVTICASVSEALATIAAGPPDFALLDVNLGKEQSVPVAERLAELGIPFVVATGYGEAQEIIAAYPPCEIVQKPFSEHSLAEAFRKALDRQS
jgi:light-regulated signal transduction histidine kinase (bacteriophytochrome)